MERVEGLGCGRRFGDPAGWPLAATQDDALDEHLDPEDLRVVGSDGFQDPVDGADAGRPLGVLLEAALGALQRGWREVELDLGRGKADDPFTRRLPADIEVDRAGDSLERLGQEGRPAAPSAGGFALPQQQVVAEVQAAGEAGQAGGRHDRRATGGQDTLVVIGVTGEEGVRDRQVDDRVTEEFEAFVVAGRVLGMLVKPAGVDQGLAEQVEVADTDIKPAGEEGAAGEGGGRLSGNGVVNAEEGYDECSSI